MYESALLLLLWLLSLGFAAYLVLGAPRNLRGWLRMLRETRGQR